MVTRLKKASASPCWAYVGAGRGRCEDSTGPPLIIKDFTPLNLLWVEAVNVQLTVGGGGGGASPPQLRPSPSGRLHQLGPDVSPLIRGQSLQHLVLRAVSTQQRAIHPRPCTCMCGPHLSLLSEASRSRARCPHASLAALASINVTSKARF